MPFIRLEASLCRELNKEYVLHGCPLGKSRKGRKKWVKRFAIKSLVDYANKVLAAEKEKND